MKKTLLFGIAFIFSIMLVSGFQFDNAGIYDPDTKEITVKNAFGLGDELAKIRLITEDLVYVSPGTDKKVAELQFYNFDKDYGDALNKMQFYDKNNFNQAINRNFKYKYKENVKQIAHPYYSQVCDGKLTANGTQECRTVTNYYYVNESRWIEFISISELPNGKVNVGIFADVYEQDYVEWIPTFFGVRIDEWATWTSNFNDGLFAYWNMTDVNDATGDSDITDNTGSAIFQSDNALLDFALNLTETSNMTSINNSNFEFLPNDNRSLVFWIYPNSSNPSVDDYIITNWIGGTDGWGIHQTVGQGNINFAMLSTSANRQFNISTTARWLMIGVTKNASTTCFYANSTELLCEADSTTQTGGYQNLSFGFRDGQDRFIGLMDEVGFWNRTLTSSEISDLYNDGTGLTFPGEVSVEITLDSPANASSTPDDALLFNYTITPTVANLTNGTIEIWHSNGTLFNQTTQELSGTVANSSFFNITGILFDTYTWNVIGCVADDSTTVCNSAPENFTFIRDAFTVTNESFSIHVKETDDEPFQINITIAEAITSTSATLHYNTTTSQAGTVDCTGLNCTIDTTLDIPTNDDNATEQNRSFFWEVITSDGVDTFSGNTTARFQNSSLTNFSWCGGDLMSTPFINFTYQNETTANEDITAFVSSSTWNFWIGSGTGNKSFTFSNANEFNNHTFCGVPINETINVDVSYSYDNSEAQQRNYNPGTLSLTDSITEQILFLLPTSDGIFVTFQVINAAEQPVSGATVTLSRAGFGTVATETTGASGTVTIFLNPSFTYTLTVTATGFDTFTATQTFPTTEFTVGLGGTASPIPSDFSREIGLAILPTDITLFNNTDYSFNITLTSTFWTVDSYGFFIYNSSGTIFNETSESANGGTLNVFLNTGNNTNLILDAFWDISGNVTNISRSYIIITQGDTSFSILQFITHLQDYLAVGMFGLETGDESFGLRIILFLAIFLFVGVLAFKFGLTSPGALTGLTFAIVAFFDVGLEIIPNPVNAIPHFPTVFVGLILIAMLIKQGIR